MRHLSTVSQIKNTSVYKIGNLVKKYYLTYFCDIIILLSYVHVRKINEMIEHRAVTPIIARLREILRGKKVVTQLRHADLIAARTQPPPEIPGGPYHKTSKVYYFSRDVRREVEPPIEVLVDKQITEGSEKKAIGQKYITPGKKFMYS